MVSSMSSKNSDDYVVLLHGLGRGSKVMRKLESHLSEQGYHVYNDNYLSTQLPIEALVEKINQRVLLACPDQTKQINFVTFSMGGLIVRLLIEKYRPSNLGRVVMIAPPNQGSRVAEFFRKFWLYRKLYGPAGQQIGHGAESIIHQLGKVDYEAGIIAGDRTVDPIFSLFILSGSNDGKVSVENTKLEGMKDHIVVHASHTFIPVKTATILQVEYFLRYGSFFHKKK